MLALSGKSNSEEHRNDRLRLDLALSDGSSFSNFRHLRCIPWIIQAASLCLTIERDFESSAAISVETDLSADLFH